MENIKLLIIVIAAVGLTFMVIQFFNIVQNYSEIMKFNSTYNKFEFGDLPSNNYIDTKEYDPNDYGITSKMKWRCVYVQDGYYQISNQGVIIDSYENFVRFDFEKQCTKNLFSFFSVKNYTNPCGVNTALCNAVLKI
ncbi:putative virion surface protein [Carp edema virus]|nr:putative virion surface protein [Carp edema virus]